MGANRILVVEDEFLIALDIAAALEGGGFAVVGPLGSVDEALGLLEREAIDGALLDANLGGHSVDRLADALATRGVPFAFVSGYGPEQLPTAHRGAPLVRKPFTCAELVAAAARFTRSPGG
jgi:DNA-binding response OmpR family regulator